MNAFAVLIHGAQTALCPCKILLGGFAVPANGLGFVFLGTLAVFAHHAQIALRLYVPLFSGFAVPAYGFSFIFADAATRFIHGAKVELCFCYALLCSPAEMLGSLRIVSVLVAAHAVFKVGTVCVVGHQFQRLFGALMSLFGGLRQPVLSLRHILFDATTQHIASAEEEHSLFVALIGSLAEPVNCRFVIHRNAIGAIAVEYCCVDLRVNFALFGGFEEPLQRLGLVFSGAAPVLVHDARVELGVGIAKLRCLHKAVQRLFILSVPVEIDALTVQLDSPGIIFFFAVICEDPVQIVQRFLCIFIALIRCLLEPLGGFVQIFLYAPAQNIHGAKIVLTRCVALLGGEPVQLCGLLIILCHAVAVLVHHAQIVLGHLVALVGSLAEPDRGIGLVIFLVIQVAQREVGVLVALLGGLAVPADRFVLILCHAVALFIKRGQMVLGNIVALFCRHAEPLGSLFVILRYAQTLFV